MGDKGFKHIKYTLKVRPTYGTVTMLNMIFLLVFRCSVSSPNVSKILAHIKKLNGSRDSKHSFLRVFHHAYSLVLAMINLRNKIEILSFTH